MCGLPSVPDPAITPPHLACPDLTPSPSSPTPCFLPPLFPGPSMLLMAPQRRVAGIKADGGGVQTHHSRAGGPRAEGIHLLGRPGGSPPAKALVILV